jgi:hypothetical protein
MYRRDLNQLNGDGHAEKRNDGDDGKRRKLGRNGDAAVGGQMLVDPNQETAEKSLNHGKLQEKTWSAFGKEMLSGPVLQN